MICGEGAEVIKESKGGLVCNSGDFKNLSKIFAKMISLEKSILRRMGMNGKEYAKKEFSKKSLLKKLNKFFIETSNNSSNVY